ncbi:hypothetical protein [Ferribacterium limneticum]|uniref:hypothetical protein n=1 Tax=Ferribacterium limneticum TaxID=76259 RepID=UPI001CFBD731|nr:hypothetical protein [Ferribacterium limneticum]UCV17828.1 hypothetical protein KI610_13495 [Ferribacterium limneticum]
MVKLTWERFGVVRECWGCLTEEELESSAMAIQGDARLDDMYYSIHDFSNVTDFSVSDNGLEFMGARAGVAVQRNTRLKVAFVGDHPVLSKLINAFNDSGLAAIRIQRFDTLEDARNYVSTGVRMIHPLPSSKE